MTLYDLIPRDEKPDGDLLLTRFLDGIAARNLQLYPAQETAILELFDGKNVILNTPTGSGKSLVATALHFLALAQGRRSVYTCPIKALVNEKFMALCREFGPQNVGVSTGDASVNQTAPILCCTAEILANIALRQGEDCPIQEVVMDEFHYYADRDRGWAWQAPLLTLPRARFLLMSATLGETGFFETELKRLTGRATVTVSSTQRPVPLEFAYSELPLAKTMESLIADGKAPVYVVHFTQLEAAQSAQDFTSINVCTREEKNQIAAAVEGFKFSSPYGPDLKRWLKHGIGLHHAGLLPKYRVLVEQLAQKGLLHVICGTDTLGVGINVPIRTVLFTRLCKFDGQKTTLLSARDFHQISGRAGRKGFDDRGWVVAQAPEHVIENLKLAEKSARDGKKTVKRQAPEKNFINWEKNTFLRLMTAPPEPLASRFRVTHGMLLNVLSRPTDGCAAMQRLIRDCHDSPKAKKSHRQRAWQLFRSLVDRNIVKIIPRTERGARLRVNIDLPENFALDQALSLYLLDTIPSLPADAPEYPLRLLTLIESILENPDVILRKQLDKVKTQKMAEMKMEGVDYDRRLEELEKLEYPKPDREFIYSTFNAFAALHPWIGQENIQPKSIAREMYETYRSFSDYIRDYELQRAEGVLLRHLNSVYKVLAQTVPLPAKTEAVKEMELYLAAMIRQIDSSLLDEWEKMRDPNFQRVEAPEVRPVPGAAGPPDITKDTASFTAAIRHKIFSFLRGLIVEDFAASLTEVEASGGEAWTAEKLGQAWLPFYDEHKRLCLDPEARNARHTYLLPADGAEAKVQQMLLDPDGHNDWVAEFKIDLALSKSKGEPVLHLLRIGPLTN